MCLESNRLSRLLSNFSRTIEDLYKTLLQCVRRERLIAQTRSDQNRDFAFRAAAERAQVEQDDSPSRNIVQLTRLQGGLQCEGRPRQ